MTRSLKICVLGAVTAPHVVARAEVFRRFGHDVSLVSPVPGSVDGMAVAAPARRDGLFERYARFADIIRLVASQRADIYHAHYAADPTTWAAWICRKRPLVVSVMGGDVLFEEQGTLGWLGRALTRSSLRAANLVTVKSALLAERVRAYGVAPQHVRVVIWGVDRRLFFPRPEDRSKTRRAWNVPDDAFLVFSPRALQPLYNQEVLVEALARVPDAILAISTTRADAGYQRRIEQKVASLGLSRRVVLVPDIAFSNMAFAYSAADLVISIPSSDGFPQSVLEAAACGVPVVMSNLERYRELLEHQASAYFTAISPPAVASALRTMMEQPDRRQAMAAAAMAIVAERCDFDEQAAMVEAEFQRLAGA